MVGAVLKRPASKKGLKRPASASEAAVGTQAVLPRALDLQDLDETAAKAMAKVKTKAKSKAKAVANRASREQIRQSILKKVPAKLKTLVQEWLATSAEGVRLHTKLLGQEEDFPDYTR